MVSNNLQNKSLPPPRLTLSETEWDFEKIKPIEKPSHIFFIRNNGGEELIIGWVHASCGCTATVLESKNILLGEVTELKVAFDPKGYEGKVGKNIYIDSNDPEVPTIKVVIKAEVEHMLSPEAEFSLNYYDLGLVSQGDSPIILNQKRNKIFKLYYLKKWPMKR